MISNDGWGEDELTSEDIKRNKANAISEKSSIRAYKKWRNEQPLKDPESSYLCGWKAAIDWVKKIKVNSPKPIPIWPGEEDADWKGAFIIM